MKKIVIASLVILTSCNIGKNKEEKKEDTIEKPKCTTRRIELTYIDKYLEVIDSCETYKGYPKFEYYDDEKLYMHGYSERYLKQGKWSFLNSGKEVINGEFKDSQPLGTWQFHDIGEINWDMYDNLENGYSISLPLEWEFSQPEGQNIIALTDTKNSKDYNFLCTITSGNIKDLSDDFTIVFNNMVASLKGNKDINDFTSKKLSINGMEAAYELQYNINDYKTNEFLYNFNGKIYMLSISLKKSASYDYSVIKEILLTSFKMYDDDKE